MAEKIMSLKFRPTFENVDAARIAIYTTCRKYYDEQKKASLADLILAATEAMNNAVEHSGAKEVEVEVTADPKKLVFRMITEGPRFDPTEGAEFPDLDSYDELPEGGFGRAMMREMVEVEKYDYADGRNILTLEKNMIKEGGV